MSDDELCYDIKAIFNLLNTAFDDPTLETFCLIYFPGIKERFGRGMGKDEKINLLIEDCNRAPEQRFKKLLEAVRQEDEQLYDTHGPYRRPCDDDSITRRETHEIQPPSGDNISASITGDAQSPVAIGDRNIQIGNISTAGELTKGTVTEVDRRVLQQKPIDFVIVTTLEEERDALLDKLSGYQRVAPSRDDIRVYFESNLPTTFPDGSTGTYRVVVMPLLDMGRVQAATATGDAIRQWKPRYVILAGIAGGIAARGVRLGDILISNQIVDYELQEITPEGPKIRWEVHRADPRLVGAVRNFSNDQWPELVTIKRPRGGMPERHIGPIASGDKVIAFSEALTKYRDIWPKLVGVEMEAGGVAAASFQAIPQPGFFMIRAVSDLANAQKNSPRVKKWHSYACDVAASYTIALLRSGPVPLSPI